MVLLAAVVLLQVLLETQMEMEVRGSAHPAMHVDEHGHVVVTSTPWVTAAVSPAPLHISS
jgi:hypothetical protein